MNKVIVLSIIGVIVVAISAYPVEENDSSESKSTEKSQYEKVIPLLVAEKSKNDTDNSQDTSDDGNSTELAYVEETFIEVLIPGIPQLNATQLEALLNSTANDTKTDNDRLKRSPDDSSSEEDSKESSEEKSSEEKAKSSNSPSRSTANNTNTDNGPSKRNSSKSSSNKDDSKESSEEDSSKSDSSEEKGKSSNSRSKRGAVDSKEKVAPNNGSPRVQSKPPAAPFMHSAQNLYPSKDDKGSVRHTEPANNNNRQTRDVVDSSRKSTEAGPVVYVTPHSKVNTAVPRVATASASPAVRAENF